MKWQKINEKYDNEKNAEKKRELYDSRSEAFLGENHGYILDPEKKAKEEERAAARNTKKDEGDEYAFGAKPSEYEHTEDKAQAEDIGHIEDTAQSEEKTQAKDKSADEEKRKLAKERVARLEESAWERYAKSDSPKLDDDGEKFVGAQMARGAKAAKIICGVNYGLAICVLPVVVNLLSALFFSSKSEAWYSCSVWIAFAAALCVSVMAIATAIVEWRIVLKLRDCVTVYGKPAIGGMCRYLYNNIFSGRMNIFNIRTHISLMLMSAIMRADGSDERNLAKMQYTFIACAGIFAALFCVLATMRSVLAVILGTALPALFVLVICLSGIAVTGVKQSKQMEKYFTKDKALL